METPPYDLTDPGSLATEPLRSTALQRRPFAEAATLADRLRRHVDSTNARRAELDLLIHDAQAHEHRRARFNARDRGCYRLGAAFEPFDGLSIDDIALCGFLSNGKSAVSLLIDAVRERPDANFVELLQGILLSFNGVTLRANGTYHRWAWLRNLYLKETEEFLRSPKGRDPKARWRVEKPTVDQRYLAGEIARLLQIVTPLFANRGAAFDWIEQKGGNPRFQQAPSLPVAAIGDASS